MCSRPFDGYRKKQTTKVNVTDVAKAAGVSVATVSRSFNLPAHVRDAVREKVLKIAGELGYMPNASAKALRLRKTNIIGAIVPTLTHSIYSTMMNSFQQEMARYGYVVCILTCGFDSAAILNSAKKLIEQGVEGLLVVGQISDQATIDYINSHQTPVVCTYSFIREHAFPCIGFDNYQSSQVVAEYMLGLGHRNFCLLTGPMQGNDRQQARTQAFIDTLSNFHEVCRYRMYECQPEFTISFGEQSLRRAQLDFPEATAIVCNSDVIAFGVLSACKRVGINVPQDLSVVGFDNLEFSEYLNPPLPP
ncbi:LacI family DNA-binding transcriptional regulator [Pseudomonas monteilii]|uniref:LacI family DNA-binding transcriptional regulator n=1 Tax=Pseudomonas monteilii TaxID=76759 RepID=UPI0022A8F9C9|nr:LacI family DNA-binding transcriptional regulator [Pseudomonas monteilii]